MPRFDEVAAKVGIRFAYRHGGSGRFYYPELVGGGCALFDYDGDGWLDVFFPQGAPLSGSPPERPRPGRAKLERAGRVPGGGRAATGAFDHRLYRNLGLVGGQLRFRDVTHEAGVAGWRNGRKLYAIGCAVGDYDGDGDLDLFVTGFRGSILYRNDGHGRFADATRAAGLPDARFGTSAAFVDYDRDGWLDLLVCEYVEYEFEARPPCADPTGHPDYCQPDHYPPTRSRLFRNTGRGRFIETTRAAGLVRPGRALGVVAGDVDDDGWPDLYLACDQTPNLLYINQRNGTFREEAVVRGCALGPQGQRQSGMGTDLGDVDGDGRLDLVVTNYWMETNNLFRNLGGGLFADEAMAFGLGAPNMRQVSFGVGLEDFDNDGRPDLFVTNGHVLTRTEHATPGAGRAQTDQLFLNRGERFEEVSGRAGEWFQRRHVGRGAAFGDVDNDGDIDVLLSPNEGPAALLLNRSEMETNRGTWLSLALRMPGPNRYAIGARVEVTAGGRRQCDEVRSAYSYCSASDLRLHFGLGAVPSRSAAAGAEEVRVRWPDGRTEVFRNVPAGRHWTLVRGTGLVTGPVPPLR